MYWLKAETMFMGGNMRRWSGGLMVAVLVSWLVASPACTPEPPASVPGDLEIHYSWGACHAERGRYELTINSNGEADFVKSFGPPLPRDGEEQFSEQSEFNLSDEELLGIYQIIITNNFFGLGGSYSDRSIMDGDCSSLRVMAEGEENEVFVSNKRVERFDRITAALTAILDSKIPDWEDLDWEALEEQEPPTSVPGDLEIHYSWGACHAERGRYKLTINAKGEANFEKSEGHPKDVERYRREQSEFNLSEEELLGIYQEIMKNSFFGLDEEYYDPDIMDGSCSSLSVKAEGEEHKVFVQNRRIARFNRITAKITAILASKIPAWKIFEEDLEKGPDLTVTGVTAIVTGVTAIPLSVKAGETISVSFRVENWGGPTPGSFSNRVYLEKFGQHGAKHPLGDFKMDPLEAGGSQTKTVDVTIPQVSPGEYWLCVFCDVLEEIEESDDTHNVDACLINIEEAPEPAPPETGGTGLSGN